MPVLFNLHPGGFDDRCHDGPGKDPASGIVHQPLPRFRFEPVPQLLNVHYNCPHSLQFFGVRNAALPTAVPGAERTALSLRTLRTFRVWSRTKERSRGFWHRLSVPNLVQEGAGHRAPTSLAANLSTHPVSNLAHTYNLSPAAGIIAQLLHDSFKCWIRNQPQDDTGKE